MVTNLAKQKKTEAEVPAKRDTTTGREWWSSIESLRSIGTHDAGYCAKQGSGSSLTQILGVGHKSLHIKWWSP